MEQLETSVISPERKRYIETAINVLSAISGTIETFKDKERLSTSKGFWFHSLLTSLGYFALAKDRYPTSNEKEWVDAEKRDLRCLKDNLIPLLPPQEKEILYQVIQERLPQYTSFIFS